MDTSFEKQVVAYVASKELAKISSLLPSNKRRSLMVHSLVSSMGLMSPEFSESKRIQVINPVLATYKDLAVYHSREYLDFVLDPKNSSPDMPAEATGISEFGLEDDCPPFAGLHQYVQLVAGATLTAARSLTKGVSDIAICWDGGRHHARKSYASGYCYVADCILAIMALKRAPLISLSSNSHAPLTRKPRILYLDLDLHYSDAVSEAFFSPSLSGTPQILTFSIHHAAPGFFPVCRSSKLPSVESPSFDPLSLSLPLRQGASDRTFARIWPIIERVKDLFQPDYIVIQCGLDSLAGDPCATFNWSLGVRTGSLGWCISRIVNGWEGKKLLLGGGGYHSANAARAWTYLTSIALNRTLELDTEIPDHNGFPLYGPSFTLDVTAGNMQDHNTEEYLQSVETCYKAVLTVMEERLSPPQHNQT